MLKRLLTAVLILAIFMVFTGTAFSDVPHKANRGLTRFQPAAHAPAAKHIGPMYQTGLARHGAITPAPLPMPIPPAENNVDTNACYTQNYFSSFATGAYFVKMFDATGVPYPDAMSAMQTCVADPTHVAVVDKVYGVIYYASHLGGAGLPVLVSVYADNAGLPGTLMGSATYVLPKVTAPAWYSFTLPTPITVAGAKYHVAIGNAPSAVTGDSLELYISSNTGGSQSGYYDGAVPGWFTMAAAFGSDFRFAAYSHHCEHYTSCVVENGIGPGYVDLWWVPDVSSGYPGGAELYGFGQRFVSNGPETLSVVEVRTYNNVAWNTTYGLYSSTSTNGLIVEVWPDDGTGNVNYSGSPIATYTIPGGEANVFPQTGVGVSGWNYIDFSFPTPPVMTGAWHITVRASSTNEADGMINLALSSPGAPTPNLATGADISFGPPATSLWKNTGSSPEWLAVGGQEQGLNILVKMCKDEFYQCQTQATHANLAYAWLLDGNAGFDAVAQKIKANDVNRISAIRFYTNRGAAPVADFKFDVYSDPLTGVPGTLLQQYTVTRTPGWTQLVIPGGLQVVGNFYVGYEPTVNPTPTPTVDTLKAITDDGSLGFINGGGMFAYGGTWGTLADWYGDPTYTFNIVAEVDFCSIPPVELICDPLVQSSAPTGSVNYGRTGHTNISTGDAYRNLTLKWKYHDPNFGTTGGLVNASPIVWDTFVVCGFASKYVIMSLNDGTVLKTISGAGAPNYIQNSSNSSIPTIATIDLGGTPHPVLFIGGGNTGGINAYQMDAPSFPLLWTLANGNASATYGFPTDPGNTAFVNFIVLRIGANDVLFFADGTPYVWACNAATGMYIWGPTILVGAPFRGMATDGTNLFVSTTAAPPGIPNGDVFSIKAATGAINWKLSTAVGGGLKGGTVYTSFANETFPDGIAYDNGQLFTTSSTMATPTHPADGVLYYLNSTTGAVQFAVATPHVPCYTTNGNLTQGTPIVDVGRIIVPGASIWATPPLGGTIVAYNRLNASQMWAMNPGNHAGQNGTRCDAVLDCQLGQADLLYASSIFGYLSCINSYTGDEIFNRRIDVLPNTNDGGVNRMMGVTIAKNGEVIATARYGELYCLAAGADRPRLEIVNYSPNAPTYGPLASVLVDYGPVFTNTGIGTLTGDYMITDALGSGLGAPRGNGSETSQKAATLASLLTANSEMAWKYAGIAVPNEQITSSSRVTSRAAAATPFFVNNPGPYPFTLNPGDTGHIIVDMKQNVITRGGHPFYAYFENTNDPDFFLNNGAANPYIMVTVIGGCITDTTTMHFGASSANWVTVFNNGRLADGGTSFSVDGKTADVFQGTYIYGVTKNRIALSVIPWQSGSTELDAWTSLQGDPNLCNVNCKPALSTIASLGSITADGITYTALGGRLVCRSFVDSVQNFATGFTSWLWDNSPASYDADSTMGLKTDSRVIGFVNAPAPYTSLNNVLVDFMKIYPRYGQAVPNWKMGVVCDYDVSKDSAFYNGPLSLGVDFSTSATRPAGGYGWVKLPYGGCGTSAIAPLINTKALNEDQALFNATAAVRDNGYLDSVYAFMSLAPNGYGQSAVSAASDQAFHATFIANNFVGNDTLSFAVAHLCLPLIASPKVAATYAPLSKLLNQWVGYGRGDANNDGNINIADIVYLAAFVNGGPKGPIPFQSVGDVNADGAVDGADVTYLVNYYFFYGPCPLGKYITY